MAYPSTIATFGTVTPTDRLNDPSHSALHNYTGTAVNETQTFIGNLASAAGTLVYDIRSPLSNGGGHVQTANKGGTSQTTYNKGDILVGQSSSVLTKLAVGVDGFILKANSSTATGIEWGANPIAVTSFISSSVISISSVFSRVYVELWGGGGSGGAENGTGETGGGGGGGYIAGFINPVTLPSSILVMVGAGGNSISNAAGGVGQSGGVTVFHAHASLLTAYGGGGGASGFTGAAGGGGAGNLTSGSPASGTNAGGGGSILGGTGGGSNAAGAAGYYGGGGGGDGANGGKGWFGGGGGGGTRSSAMGTGGTSAFAGAGSAGSIVTSGSVTAGSTPGGGGGGGYGSGGSSGQGGSGMCKITFFG